MPADRESFRRWLSRFDASRSILAVEGCTGWRFIVEECRVIGVRAHLAEPADVPGLKGRRQRAPRPTGSTRAICACCWRPTSCRSRGSHPSVLEIRAKVRLYMDLLEARGDWLQRIHPTLFQLGAPAQPQLLGRDPDRLARLEGLQSIGSSHPLYERSRPWLEIMPRGFLGCRRAGSPSRRRPGSVANRRRSLPVLAPPAGERGVERPIGYGDLPGRDRRAPSSRSATRRSPA